MKKLISYLVVFTLIFNSSSAFAGELYNGCRAFFDTDSAMAYYQVANMADLDVESPKMVRNTAGMDEPFMWNPGYEKLQIFRKINNELREKILDKAIKQAADVFYLIKEQKGGIEHFYDHRLEILPKKIADVICRFQCENRESVEQTVKAKIDGLSRMGYARYTFKEISSKNNFLISGLNNHLKKKKTHENYKLYLKKYFLMFQGFFGILNLTHIIKKKIGRPVTQDEYFKNDFDFHEELNFVSMEKALYEYKYFMNQNWALKNNKIYNNMDMVIEDRWYSKEEVNREVAVFSLIVKSAPEFVAELFQKNELYQNWYCIIFDSLDTYYIENGNEEAKVSSMWYLSPILLGMLFIPFLGVGAGLYALQYFFYALTALTVVDIGSKLIDLNKSMKHKNSVHSLTQLSTRQTHQVKRIMKISAQLEAKGKTIGSILILELIGLGIASKIIKVGKQVFQKTNNIKLKAQALKALNLNKLGINKLFYKFDIQNAKDLDKFFKTATDEEIYKLIVQTKGLSIGKKIMASEVTIEGAKLGYIYANSQIYGEVNPASILLDAIAGKYEDLEKQAKLDEMIEK